MTDDIGVLLQERGYRVTRPRQAVWRVLVDADDHLTAEQVADRANRHDDEINLASVYRSLALFKELDLVRESRLGRDDASTWELAHPDEHFHLVCEECGRVDHHVGSLVEMIRTHLADGHGFHPTDIELVVTGRCHDCARSS